ncbi:hypothetical protein [Saccharothrix saharensis]|uniref:hypothetical protein n=1 Tax=Saccharothrix saharensis TaxID=571190 RepID=UPI001B87AF4E|nr:hypothetical protein [Saccharothrix saharensis]
MTHDRDGWCAESGDRACSPSGFSVTTTSRPRSPSRSATRTSSGDVPGDHGRCGVRG